MGILACKADKVQLLCLYIWYMRRFVCKYVNAFLCLFVFVFNVIIKNRYATVIK